jgi:hypothetical protein
MEGSGMTQEEILDVIQAEKERLWQQYLELREIPAFERVALQVQAKHHQTARIWERIFAGEWRR